MSTIVDNLINVRKRITAAEEKFGRLPGSVTLIAVSKTKPAALIQEAIAANQQVFGESYVQEALSKQREIDNSTIQWHFIGPIQSNKTRAIAENFDWVHSVDREKIAQRLNDQRPENKPALNILLQVNISSEDSKAGVEATQVKNLVKSILHLPRLTLRGLMAIPVKTENFAEQRMAFKRLAELQTELNHEFEVQLDCLSMGMSNDMEAAIAEGATHIRVGTDIFGARSYKQ